MNCEHALEFLEVTVGDTVDPSEVRVADAAAARAHVASCAACAKLRGGLRAGAASLESLYATDAAGDAALVASVRARLPGGRVASLPRWRWAAAAVVLVSCGLAYVAAQRADRGRGEIPRETEVAAVTGPGLVPGYAGPRFVDVTAASGIDFVDHTGEEAKDWMVETVGHGAAAFDMDGDGDVDLFVPDGNRLAAARRVSGTWRLYRNDGGMRFTDVTKGSGLECDAWAGAAVAGDVTGDGLPDVYVACWGENRLFANLGGGRFEDVTAKAGVAGLDVEWSTAACMADFDGNGALDLFVSNYADMRRFMGEAPGPRGCRWRDMPVACGPQPLEPQLDRLFLNRGDGTFDDVSATNLPKLRRYAFQCIALDVTADGAPDVFVACDGHPNMLLVNDGRGRFTDVAPAAGVSADATGRYRAGMGVAAGDVDGDGLTDLFVTNFSHEPNTLFRARSAGPIPSFADVTGGAALEESDALLGWGTTLLDYDCDGSLDVLFANGHLYPGVGEQVPSTSYAQPMTLCRNAGGGRFAEVTASAGDALAVPRAHRGLVTADFDDDGRLDAFVTVLNGPAVLFRNDGRGAGNSIRFSLRRKDGRTEAPGARVVVTVRTGETERRISRDVLIGSSFASSEDSRLVVGVGAAERVESVEVRWPFGEVQRFGAMDAGHLYELTEARPEPRRLR